MKVSSSSVVGQSGSSYVTAIFAGAIGGVVFIVVAIILLVRVCDTSSRTSNTVSNTSKTSLSPKKKRTGREDLKVFVVDSEAGDFEMRSTRVDEIYAEGQSIHSERNPSIFNKNN